MEKLILPHDSRKPCSYLGKGDHDIQTDYHGYDKWNHTTGVEDEAIEKGKEAGVIFVPTLAALEGYRQLETKTGRSPANMEWTKR